MDKAKKTLLGQFSYLKESFDTIDEDLRKDKYYDKLLLQFDHELSYLYTDIAMGMLDKYNAVVAVLISGYVVKTLLWKI